MTISLKNLSVGYDRHPAVHHISGVFAAGSLTAVIGPNGGGKSTLLKAIAGFLKPMSGSIDFNGIAKKQIAYLPQQSETDRTFPLNVMDVVLLGFWNQNGPFRRPTKAQREQALEALEKTGMKIFGDRPIAALSAGQWRRVLFARMMLQDAQLLLLDEPFAAIDIRTAHDLMHILQHWQEEGRTIITVMHDIPSVRDHFPQALMLAREVIGWGATTDVLRDENFARAAALANNWVEDPHACERVA